MELNKNRKTWVCARIVNSYYLQTMCDRRKGFKEELSKKTRKTKNLI